MHAFTLAELLVVIVVIWILLTIGQNIAWDRVWALRYQNEVSARYGSVQNTIWRARTSSFVGESEFDSLEISLFSWSTFSYSSSTGILLTEKFDHSYTSISWSITAIMEPYALSCQWSWTITLVSNQIASEQCFYLQNTPCRIVKNPCSR